MRFPTWLDEEPGRLTKMAAHFDVSPSAISQWRANGVPPARMKAVRDFTENLVTLEEMLPDPPRRKARRQLARKRSTSVLADGGRP